MCQLGIAGQTAPPTTDKLLQLAIALCIYHICGWWVTNLIRIIGLVGVDIPHLPHVLWSKESTSEGFNLDEIGAPPLAPSTTRPSSGFFCKCCVQMSLHVSIVVKTYTFETCVPILR